MDYLWDFPEGTSFREIYKHFTEVKGRDWRAWTLYTYLTILMEQGFLRTEGSRRMELLTSQLVSRDTCEFIRRFWRMLMTILL